MPSILLTAPAIEPLTLSEAKDWLRVEHGDDNAIIAALIASARSHVEAHTRRALIAQTWRLIRDVWPTDGRIAVLPAPLREALAARVYDAEGLAYAVDIEAFVADTASSVLAFAPWSLRQPGRPFAGIEIDVESGYGENAADVPAPLRQAIRILLAHWYEHRGMVSEGAAAALPAGVASLIAPFRVASL